MTTSRLVGGILAVVLIVGGLWVFRASSPPEQTQTTPESRQENKEPDVFARDVRYTQLLPDGSLQYRLLAKHVSQFEDDEVAYLANPDMHLPGATGVPWDITAQQGTLRREPNKNGTLEDVIDLKQDVVIRQNHPQNGMTTLRSDSFKLYPEREFAETTESVMLDTDVGRTSAAGMTANLATGLLSLTSDNEPAATPPGENRPISGNNPKTRVRTIILPEQFKAQQ